MNKDNNVYQTCSMLETNKQQKGLQNQISLQSIFSMPVMTLFNVSDDGALCSVSCVHCASKLLN